VKRRNIPLIRRDGSVRPHESRRAARRLRQVLGRVLEVAVHCRDDRPAGAGEPGVHRRVLAEVALEPDAAHTLVAGVEPLDRREGFVYRPIVDEDQLEVTAIERCDRTAIELLERPRLVEDGDDDRELRRRRRLVERNGPGHVRP
jgi:hypothetical protein